MGLNLTVTITKAKLITSNRIALMGHASRPGHFTFKAEYTGVEVISEDFLEEEKGALRDMLESIYGFNSFNSTVVNENQYAHREL